MIKVKRVYLPQDEDDGYRVLIDRLWPRGVKKSELEIDEWAKDLAPSTELRKTLHAHPEDWREFQDQYRTELRSKSAQEHLATLASKARRGHLTLVSAAKEQEHNHIPILRHLLEAKVKRCKLGSKKKSKD